VSTNLFNHTPTLDELPVGAFDIPPEDIPDDERTFTEIYAADAQTVATRKKASAFAAAFNAVMRRAGVIKACNELDLDADQVMRFYLTLIDAAQRTEYEAERSNAPCSKVRRFKCGMYMLELFFKRATMPYDLTEEERKRRVDTLGRTARRRWDKIHRVQRHLHLGFFVHEKGEAADRKKKAGHFTDNLTDLLAHTARRAGELRGEPINRYNRAADEALAHFRATVPLYAPEWTHGDTDPTPPVAEPKQSKESDPWKTIKSSFKKSVRDALLIVREQGLSEDEALAKRAELQAFIETEWTGAPHPAPQKTETARAVFTSLPPVTVNADTGKNESVSASPESDLDRTPVSYLNDPETANLLGKTQSRSDDDAPQLASPEDQATATVEAFQSVGATRFKVVVLNAKPVSSQSQCIASEDTDAAALLANVGSYIERSERQSESVCLRPQDGALIQVDDCNAETLALLQPFAFAGIETSPGSFQPWLALPPDIGEEKRKDVRDRLLRKLKDTGANGGAFNSVRLPGALNAKEKHKATFGEYPRVRLVYRALGRVVTPEELERAGLLAPAEEKPTAKAPPHFTSSSLPDHFPDFNEYLNRKWLDSEKRPDRSSAEIAWCCAALRKGFPKHMVADELRRVSLKAKGRRDSYVEKTVDSAASWLATQPQTSPQGARERMVV
jgi:hypothetical protein